MILIVTGITGGEEDGVDNTGVDNAALYTQPEDIWEVYKTLSQVTTVLHIYYPVVDREDLARCLPTSVLQLHSETSMEYTNLEMSNSSQTCLESIKPTSRRSWVDQKTSPCKSTRS
jgi:hypothetical protein